MTEKELREEKEFSPKTQDELIEYINKLVTQEHDYGTCVYAMSLSAVATFNYVAYKLGVTGFQASCADLDILRHTRSIKGSFILLKGEDLLYPQYNLLQKFQEWKEEQKDWLKKEAQRLLNEKTDAHHEVIAHWKKLAGVTD